MKKATRTNRRRRFTDHINVWITPAMREALAMRAAAEEVEVSTVVRQAIVRYLRYEAVAKRAK